MVKSSGKTRKIHVANQSVTWRGVTRWNRLPKRFHFWLPVQVFQHQVVQQCTWYQDSQEVKKKVCHEKELQLTSVTAEVHRQVLEGAMTGVTEHGVSCADGTRWFSTTAVVRE